MCQLSGIPDDPEEDTIREMQGANAQYATVKRLMHAI
jgi:hypothetical protein